MNKNFSFAAILLLAATLAIALTAASPSRADVVTEASVAEWLAAYGEAWETRDAEAAAALFTPDATYRESPFEAAFDSRSAIREYWSRVTADQRDVSFTSDVVTTFESSAVAHWSARFASVSAGSTINLDGVFLLEFGDDGLCSSLKEWWIVKVDDEAGETSEE